MNILGRQVPWECAEIESSASKASNCSKKIASPVSIFLRLNEIMSIATAGPDSFPEGMHSTCCANRIYDARDAYESISIREQGGGRQLVGNLTSL